MKDDVFLSARDIMEIPPMVWRIGGYVEATQRRLAEVGMEERVTKIIVSRSTWKEITDEPEHDDLRILGWPVIVDPWLDEHGAPYGLQITEAVR